MVAICFAAALSPSACIVGLWGLTSGMLPSNSILAVFQFRILVKIQHAWDEARAWILVSCCGIFATAYPFDSL